MISSTYRLLVLHAITALVYAAPVNTNQTNGTITTRGPYIGNTSELWTGFTADAATTSNSGFNSSQLGLPFIEKLQPELQVIPGSSFGGYDRGKLFYLYACAVYNFWRESRYSTWSGPIYVNDDPFGQANLEFWPNEDARKPETKETAAWAAYALLDFPFQSPFDERSWLLTAFQIVDRPFGYSYGNIVTKGLATDSGQKVVPNEQQTAAGALSARDLNVTAPVPVPIGIHVNLQHSASPSSKSKIVNNQLFTFELFRQNFKLMWPRTASNDMIWPPELGDKDLELRLDNDQAVSRFKMYQDMKILSPPIRFIEYTEGMKQILEQVVKDGQYGNLMATIFRGGYRIATLEIHFFDSTDGAASA